MQVEIRNAAKVATIRMNHACSRTLYRVVAGLSARQVREALQNVEPTAKGAFAFPTVPPKEVRAAMKVLKLLKRGLEPLRASPAGSPARRAPARRRRQG